MEAEFEKGQRVRVTKNNGEVVEGTIRDWDYNPCTFAREYSLDYMKDGKRWTMICIPEANVEAIE